jgi:hypothetical protein
VSREKATRYCGKVAESGKAEFAAGSWLLLTAAIEPVPGRVIANGFGNREVRFYVVKGEGLEARFVWGCAQGGGENAKYNKV